MIRVGQTRNLLRASSSLLEMWTRSAHHHPGQRRQSAALTGLTKVRTRSQVQKIRNSLQTERHPQKKVRRQTHPLRHFSDICIVIQWPSGFPAEALAQIPAHAKTLLDGPAKVRHPRRHTPGARCGCARATAQAMLSLRVSTVTPHEEPMPQSSFHVVFYKLPAKGGEPL